MLIEQRKGTQHWHIDAENLHGRVFNDNGRSSALAYINKLKLVIRHLLYFTVIFYDILLSITLIII